MPTRHPGCPPLRRIQELLRAEVLLQLSLVNVASTDVYYHTIQIAIRQHLWIVEPKQHKTWSDPTRATQKRKHSKTTDIARQQEHSSTLPRESLKKYRQLQLWEAPQSSEASNSATFKNINVDQPASSTEDDDNMEQMEQTKQMVRRKHSERSHSLTGGRHMNRLPHSSFAGTAQSVRTSTQSLE